jgi:hypothetical protein
MLAPRKLIDVIRELYPNPQIGPRGVGMWGEDYCVIQAIIRFHRDCNLVYSIPHAEACDIINANNRGDFDKAWELAGQALEATTSRSSMP